LLGAFDGSFAGKRALTESFEGSGFLFGGRGSCAGSRTCAASNTKTCADAAACNAADKTRLDDALCTFGQIKVAGLGSDDTLTSGFTQHFAAGTEGRSLSNTSCPTANNATSYALDDIAADLAPKNSTKSGTKGRRFHATDSGAECCSEDTGALRIDAFCDQALI
jgi:hypothetical protein